MVFAPSYSDASDWYIASTLNLAHDAIDIHPTANIEFRPVQETRESPDAGLLQPLPC